MQSCSRNHACLDGKLKKKETKEHKDPKDPKDAKEPKQAKENNRTEEEQGTDYLGALPATIAFMGRTPILTKTLKRRIPLPDSHNKHPIPKTSNPINIWTNRPNQDPIL